MCATLIGARHHGCAPAPSAHHAGADDARSMEGYRPAGWLPVKATMGFEDVPASATQRYAALAMAALLVVSTCTALLTGNVVGPEIKAFIPIAVTTWLLADLLTAFLLLAQFYVNGRIMIALLVLAYAFSGSMSVAYIGVFPGVFLPRDLPLAGQQVSVALWLLWHTTFPLLVMAASFNDATVGRLVSRRTIAFVTGFAAVVPALCAGLVVLVLTTFSRAIPLLVANGSFQPFFRTCAIPTVVALNALASVVLLMRRRRFTALSLWLAVATLSAALDAMLNLSAARYTYAWDAGKVIAVVTACTVLLAMLSDVVALYGRLARVARLDPLTSLANRRAFEEHFDVVMHSARRGLRGVGLLMIDIDLFKRYNDSYGHAAGDDCLRRVAATLALGAGRSRDLVARYGGEEFVVLLPEATLLGVREVAEKMRRAVEELELGQRQSLRRVTVSIGIAYAPDARAVRDEELFECADRALYQAKNFGRNRVALGSLAASQQDDKVAQLPFASGRAWKSTKS